MATITQKKKLSKGTWALIIVFFAAIISIAVLAIIGKISLAFLANWLVSVGEFGASSWVNEVIVIVISAVGLGVLPTYVVYTWFKGQQVKVANTPGNYQPQGQALSNPQQSGTETVIS
jgi:hypothetical protein